MMRCRYCGSSAISETTEKQNFSAGKAVAGAVVFGPVGAAAGFIGKDKKGYRCGACGAFMVSPMDTMTASSIDSAIRDAEAGRDRSMFDFLKVQYPNIQANFPSPVISHSAEKTTYTQVQINEHEKEDKQDIKHIYRCNTWIPDCPVCIEKIIIKSSDRGDVLSLIAYNQASRSLRSVYYQVIIYDDANDEICTTECVYQGMDVKAGELLPQEKEFSLNTEAAYKVAVNCIKAVFMDDSVWRNSEDTPSYELTKQVELSADNFRFLKYVRDELRQNERLSESAPLFSPVEHDEFWQCICGHPVLSGKACPYCGSMYDNLKSVLSQKHLQEVQQRIVKQRAASRAQKTMQSYDQAYKAAEDKKKKQEEKKKQEIERKTENNYKAAGNLQASGKMKDLERAIIIYQDIIGWKDSAEQVNKCSEQIEKLKDRQVQLEKMKVDLQVELDSLKGLFKGKQRKDLEKKIAETQREIDNL